MNKIAISGSTGFIGSSLADFYKKKGFEVIPLHRGQLYGSVEELASTISGCDAVIHLSGAPIIQRWSGKNKKVIWESRVRTTGKLVNAIAKAEKAPHVLLNASAVGIYPVRGRHSEYSDARDPGFLGEVTTAWEEEALKAEKHTRVLRMRFGIVLGSSGGALPKLLPLFRFGLGGRLGNGYQPFPWIHIDDLVKAVEFLRSREELKGPFNFTAPDIVNNRKFTVTFAKVLNRPALVPVPAFALKLLYGKAADTLLEGQDAIPERLREEGFEYQFEKLDAALEDIVS